MLDVLATSVRMVDTWHEEETNVGWNFGCAIIEFDFHSVVDPLLEPARRQYVIGNETPDELRSKALMDAGTVALEELGIPGVPDDAPITFTDASSRFFENYAVGVVNGKTILVGARFGLDQDMVSNAYAKVSVNHGAVFAFWCNDASSTYMFSVFQGGKRIRFFATGPGLDDNDGAPLPGEPEGKVHGHDRLMGLLTKVAGCSFSKLNDLTMERFAVVG